MCDLAVTLTFDLCPQLHRSYIFGEIRTSGLYDIVLTNFYYIVTDARTTARRQNASGTVLTVARHKKIEIDFIL